MQGDPGYRAISHRCNVPGVPSWATRSHIEFSLIINLYQSHDIGTRVQYQNIKSRFHLVPSVILPTWLKNDVKLKAGAALGASPEFDATGCCGAVVTGLADLDTGRVLKRSTMRSPSSTRDLAKVPPLRGRGSIDLIRAAAGLLLRSGRKISQFLETQVMAHLRSSSL